MAHKLTTYDATGDHVATRSFEGRGEAFAAFDRAVADHPNKRVARVELTGDGLNRQHVFPDAEAPDEARQAPEAGGGDRERAGGAPADAGHPGPAAQAADAPAVKPDQPKPARAAGRVANRSVTVAERDR